MHAAGAAQQAVWAVLLGSTTVRVQTQLPMDVKGPAGDSYSCASAAATPPPPGRVMSLGFRLELPVHTLVHGIKLLRVLCDNPPLCRRGPRDGRRLCLVDGNCWGAGSQGDVRRVTAQHMHPRRRLWQSPCAKLAGTPGCPASRGCAQPRPPTPPHPAHSHPRTRTPSPPQAALIHPKPPHIPHPTPPTHTSAAGPATSSTKCHSAGSGRRPCSSTLPSAPCPCATPRCWRGP